jgi:hypothetical protein
MKQTHLTPATKNPWYILATISGDITSDNILNPQDRTAIENQRFWNGWMCRDLDEQKRFEIATKLEINPSEVAPLSSDELSRVKQRLLEAFPTKSLEDLKIRRNDYIDFSKTKFETALHFSGYYFPEIVIFNESEFGNWSVFVNSQFCRRVYFEQVDFLVSPDFSYCTFRDRVSFKRAKFKDSTNFLCSSFNETVNFQETLFYQRTAFKNTNFCGSTYFNSSKFMSLADFDHTNFESNVDFTAAIFCSTTRFIKASFHNNVPKFYETNVNQDTIFSENPRSWPRITKDNAAEGKLSYTRLRKVAVEGQNIDLEQFFMRQEMRCKEELASGLDRFFFILYRIISDYGYSVSRPLFCLAAVIALGWGFIGSFLRNSSGLESAIPIMESLGISIGNTLPFLGIVNKMHPTFYNYAPAWLDALSAVQSLSGIALLFLLGLGLRNRFRLK